MAQMTQIANRCRADRVYGALAWGATGMTVGEVAGEVRAVMTMRFWLVVCVTVVVGREPVAPRIVSALLPGGHTVRVALGVAVGVRVAVSVAVSLAVVVMVMVVVGVKVAVCVAVGLGVLLDVGVAVGV
jgi:hypothetical protein